MESIVVEIGLVVFYLIIMSMAKTLMKKYLYLANLLNAWQSITVFHSLIIIQYHSRLQRKGCVDTMHNLDEAMNGYLIPEDSVLR